MKQADRHPRACHCGDHAFAILTRGSVALLDVADLPLVAGRCWSSSGWGRYNYARRGEKRGDKTVTIRMHRAIMQPPDDMEVDHASGDTLDNRRANLRICTHHENTWNSVSARGSEFKGVSWEMGGLTVRDSFIAKRGERFALDPALSGVLADDKDPVQTLREMRPDAQVIVCTPDKPPR